MNYAYVFAFIVYAYQITILKHMHTRERCMLCMLHKGLSCHTLRSTYDVCTGIGIAAVADTQLYNFVHANRLAVKAGTPRRLLLNTGAPAAGINHCCCVGLTVPRSLLIASPGVLHPIS